MASKTLRLAPLAVLLVLGTTIETVLNAQNLSPPNASIPYKAEEPANRGLDANLFMQTSAEYRACCFQAYNLASLRLRLGLAEIRRSDKKVAVIIDLDETVLDNAQFQTMQLRQNLAYDQRRWDAWEANSPDRVGLIPGAKDFILDTLKAGVEIVYISNRNERFRAQTKKALERLGIPPKDDSHLKLSTDTSDKTKRRRDVENEYEVLLIIGDNLRDFDEQFKCPKIDKRNSDEIEAAIAVRKDRVDEKRSNWGDKWIILPNPAYGEWTKPLGLGKRDLDRPSPQSAAKE